MTESRDNWGQLSDRLEALGLKLKLHLQQTGGDEMPDVLTRLRSAVVEAFDAAGNAVRDDAVKADVRDVGRLLADAATSTFTRISDEVNDLIDRRREGKAETKPEDTSEGGSAQAG